MACWVETISLYAHSILWRPGVWKFWLLEQQCLQIALSKKRCELLSNFAAWAGSEQLLLFNTQQTRSFEFNQKLLRFSFKTNSGQSWEGTVSLRPKKPTLQKDVQISSNAWSIIYSNYTLQLNFCNTLQPTPSGTVWCEEGEIRTLTTGSQSTVRSAKLGSPSNL